MPIAEHTITRRIWGESCPVYYPGCAVCDAWEYLRTHKVHMPDLESELEYADSLPFKQKRPFLISVVQRDRSLAANKLLLEWMLRNPTVFVSP